MKIGKLEQHCGECEVIDYCGNGFGFCICTDSRFAEVDEADYYSIAAKTPEIKELEICKGCKRPDCDIYRYSEIDYADEPCEHMDENRDNFCEQVADYVYSTIKGAEEQ